MNKARLTLGGLGASITIFIINGIGNGLILSNDFLMWEMSMGSTIHPPQMSTALSLWIVMSLIFGFSVVWLYVAIRPRLGAGPKTAVAAGFFLWMTAKLAVALDMITLGVLPQTLLIGQVSIGMIAFLAAGLVGGAIYKETSR
jgi:hypothetical protein